MEKKPYTPPVVTVHGDAVKLTKGFGGPAWELHSTRDYLPPPPPPPDTF